MTKGQGDIATHTKWGPGLNVIIPIDASKIESFDRWVNLRGYSAGHNGHDFGFYRDKSGLTNYHLPPDTSIMAIADGIVAGVYSVEEIEIVKIEHGAKRSGLSSWYGHVVSHLIEGQHVNQGEKIGVVCSEPMHIMQFGVHLHLALEQIVNGKRRLVDPREAYPFI